MAAPIYGIALNTVCYTILLKTFTSLPLRPAILLGGGAELIAITSLKLSDRLVIPYLDNFFLNHSRQARFTFLIACEFFSVLASNALLRQQHLSHLSHMHIIPLYAGAVMISNVAGIILERLGLSP